jgi:hypothetical protein
MESRRTLRVLLLLLFPSMAGLTCTSVKLIGVVMSRIELELSNEPANTEKSSEANVTFVVGANLMFIRSDASI